MAACLRYELLPKIGEEPPPRFEDFQLAQLWGWLKGVVRRKVRQHLEGQGLRIPEKFDEIPMLQLWGVMQRLETHAIYHKLLAAGKGISSLDSMVS